MRPLLFLKQNFPVNVLVIQRVDLVIVRLHKKVSPVAYLGVLDDCTSKDEDHNRRKTKAQEHHRRLVHLFRIKFGNLFLDLELDVNCFG